MAVTLAANIVSSDLVIPVAGDVSAVVVGRRYRIDSEIVLIRGYDQVPVGAFWSRDPLRWVTERGMDGTAPASHSSGAVVKAVTEAVATGADVTPPAPFIEGGGGALTIDNTVDPPEEVTTIIAPGAVVGGGEATLTPALGDVLGAGNDAGSLPITGLTDPADPQDAATKNYVDTTHPFTVTSETDPGAIGVGRIWVNIAGGAGDDVAEWQRRNATDDGWDDPFLMMEADGTVALTGDGTAPLLFSNGAAVATLDPDGTITLSAANGSLILTLAADASFEVNGSGVVRVLGLPSADPEVANQLYTAGVVSAGVPQALMVSGGPA